MYERVLDTEVLKHQNWYNLNKLLATRSFQRILFIPVGFWSGDRAAWGHPKLSVVQPTSSSNAIAASSTHKVLGF